MVEGDIFWGRLVAPVCGLYLHIQFLELDAYKHTNIYA